MQKGKRIPLTQSVIGNALDKAQVTYWSRMRLHMNGKDYIGYKCDIRKTNKETLLGIFPQAEFTEKQSESMPGMKDLVIAFPRKTKLYMCQF